MKRAILGVFVMLCALGLLAPRAFADKVTPSGPLKAYKGSEGEIVVMVEISDGKEMLVYFKNTGGTAEGKTLRYLFEDLGKGDKTVYINVKRARRRTARSSRARATTRGRSTCRARPRTRSS